LLTTKEISFLDKRFIVTDTLLFLIYHKLAGAPRDQPSIKIKFQNIKGQRKGGLSIWLRDFEIINLRGAFVRVIGIIRALVPPKKRAAPLSHDI